MQWESIHELNAFRLLDCDPEVIAFQEQPVEIRYELQGKLHRHFPDILVRKKMSNELWEVKTEADAARIEVAERTTLMTGDLPRLGFRYRLILAEDLGGEPRLANTLLILQHGRRAISIQERQVVIRFFNNHTAIHWKQVLDGALGPNGRTSVCRMLLEGLLELDMNETIGPKTRIQLAGRAAIARNDLARLGV